VQAVLWQLAHGAVLQGLCGRLGRGLHGGGALHGQGLRGQQPGRGRRRLLVEVVLVLATGRAAALPDWRWQRRREGGGCWCDWGPRQLQLAPALLQLCAHPARLQHAVPGCERQQRVAAAGDERDGRAGDPGGCQAMRAACCTRWCLVAQHGLQPAPLASRLPRDDEHELARLAAPAPLVGAARWQEPAALCGRALPWHQAAGSALPWALDAPGRLISRRVPAGSLAALTGGCEGCWWCRGHCRGLLCAIDRRQRQDRRRSWHAAGCNRALQAKQTR
jgi:hypothetical protein